MYSSQRTKRQQRRAIRSLIVRLNVRIVMCNGNEEVLVFMHACLLFVSNMLKITIITHPFNGPSLSGTTRVSRYQKGKISLYFTEARDSEWQ